MHREHDVAPPRDAPVHPLDLVGVHVGRRGFDRGRQVDDQLSLRARVPSLDHGVHDLHGEIELGGAEALGRILERDLGLRQGCRLLAHRARSVHRQLAHLRAAHAEHDLALRGIGRVVEVNDGPAGAAQRRQCACNQGFARLGQDLDGDVGGNAIFFDEQAHEIKVGLRGRGEADFNFLEADRDQLLEEAQLALLAHGLDQGLVAVAQIHAAPDGRAREGALGPGSLGKLGRGEGAVLVGIEHGTSPWVGVARRRPWCQNAKTLSGNSAREGFVKRPAPKPLSRR